METGAVQCWAWSTAGADCTYLIKQSITVSSHKAIVLPKNIPELDSTNSRCPSLNYPRSRIEICLSSGYYDLNLKDRLYREQVGRVWKWVILICVGPTPFLTCLRQLFSIHSRLSVIASPDLTWSSVHLPIFLALKLRDSTQGMVVLTRREVDHGVRATLRFLSKVDFFPFFRSWFKRSKEGLNPEQWRLKIIGSQVDGYIFCFQSGRGVSIIWKWPSHIVNGNFFIKLVSNKVSRSPETILE